MLNYFNKIFNTTTRLGKSKEIFKEYKEDIDNYNLKSLMQVSLVGVLISFVLMVLSMGTDVLFRQKASYLIMIVVFTAIHLFCRFYIVNKKRLLTPTYYLFVIVAYGVGILMGTIWSVNVNATTFIVLLCVFPMCILDKPLRLYSIIGIICVAFCIITRDVKPARLANLDITNCIAFYLLGVGVGNQSLKIKMSDIIVKRELKKQRDTDMLTKLRTRRSFEHIVAEYINNSSNKAVMLIMDVDNFKNVNDSLGHGYGDIVLQKVSECLSTAFDDRAYTARLGGDEFIAFIRDANELKYVLADVSKMIKKIKTLNLGDVVFEGISVSVGVAIYPDHGVTFGELYRRADNALYHAKENGKGKFAVFGNHDV